MTRKQSQRDEDTINLRNRAATKRFKNLNGSSISGSTASASPRSKVSGCNGKDKKGSAASSSPARDTSTLRRSLRETLVKNSSSSSTKSDRRENRILQTPVKKGSAERDTKQVSQSLRRSERIDKFAASSSSGSKRTGNGSGSVEMKKKVEVNAGKKEKMVSTTGTKGDQKSKKLDNNATPLSKKRKVGNARAFRVSLSKTPKKAKISDSTEMLQGYDLGVADSAVLRGGEKCPEKLLDKLNGAVEDSSSGSRELSEMALGVAGDANSASLSMRQKHTESVDSKFADNLVHVKESDSSLHNSLNGITAKEKKCGALLKESDGNDVSVACKLHAEELGVLELQESAPDDRPISHDILPESGDTSAIFTVSKRNCGLHSNISVTAKEHVLVQPIPVRDACLSSPLTERDKLEQCRKCFELQRGKDMHATDLCTCTAKHCEDLYIPSIEEVCEKFASDELGDSDCFIDDKSKENSESVAKSQLAGAEKPTSVASDCLIGADTHVKEEAVRLDCDYIDLSKAHARSTFLDPSIETQTDCDPNVCVVCRQLNIELSCDGKGCTRKYHLSCLEMPLQNMPPGLWLCIVCLKRKIEFGVHSISKGIDSVWNFKEDATVLGGDKIKYYFVKYKGLAHVHNQWVSETQMLQEPPLLLSKFSRKNQKDKAIRWKQEWTEPHRLLQKRLLMPIEMADEFFDGLGQSFMKCYFEWLVKWKGLGYEHATWELESSPFLCTPEAMALKKDYDARVQARSAFDSSNADKALEFRRNPFRKLTSLPLCCPPGLDICLDSINRLLEFWHRNQNTVFFDDQERVTKSILFMLSLMSYACRPFLFVCPVSLLSMWESEFSRLAPFINLVVYNGSKNVRQMIQNIEFYEESGQLMFQVLLTHPDTILEDFERLASIGWEAVFVDVCQNSRISKNLGIIKQLSTGFRLLLLSAQLKGSIAEYHNLLSFLDSSSGANLSGTVTSNSNDATNTLASLKEKLSHYIAFEYNQDSSKLIEYWVPVSLSNVQLEQYCATLISNSMLLRSCSKSDLVGALGEVLISTRKCCDHPYLVNEDLQSSFTRDLPSTKYLEVGVNASGKLQVLDKILQFAQKQGLRVLILFQSIGRAGKFSIGDILDDFVRQRFGADSYERVDRGLTMAKKLAALNMFNDKERGRFVFLIENRACLPSVKLSSVDVTIVYGSDWNPLNDLRALQKITIEPQHDRIVVLRLYTSFTVEERLLIFAKQEMLLENNIENISPSVCHSLLSWGALHLFRLLDEFHKLDNSTACPEGSDNMLLTDDVMEILTNLSACDLSKCSVIVKTQQCGASYSRSIILDGEREGASSLEKDSHSFWSNLLDGRCPLWRYISDPSNSFRSRRKVQILNESAIQPEPEYDQLKQKKKRANNNNIVDAIASESWLPKTGDAEGKNLMLFTNPYPPSCSSITKAVYVPISLTMVAESQPISEGNSTSYVSPSSDGTFDDNPHEIDSGQREKLQIAQRSLHLLLKPQLSELCVILKFPDNVKDMAQVFLEYVMNNHHVSAEPEMILQAFKISLCWRAASFLKHKIDQEESLALAKKYLHFTCTEEQVYNVYSKLRILRKKFSHQNSALWSKGSPSLLKPMAPVSGTDPTGEPDCGMTSNSFGSFLREFEKGALRENPQPHSISEQPVLPEQEQVPVLVTPTNQHERFENLKDELLKQQTFFINKICSRREKDLSLKQQEEILDFNKQKEKLELSLKKTHDRDLKLIYDLVLDPAEKNDKIKSLKEEFLKTMVYFEKHMDCQLQKLKGMQSIARDKEHQIMNHWLEEAKTGKLAESFDSIPLSDSGFTLEQIIVADHGDIHADLGNTRHDTGPSSTDESLIASDLVASILGNSERCTSSSGGAGYQPTQVGRLVSLSNSMDENEIFGTIEMPLEVPSDIPLSETVDMHMESEGLASEIPIMDLAAENTATFVESRTVATEKQGDKDNTEISCLESCPLDNIEQVRQTGNGDASLTIFPAHNEANPPVHAITSTVNNHGIPPSQELYFSGHEVPVLEVQGSDCTQEIPEFHSAEFATSQLDNIIAASGSLLNQLPTCNVPLVTHSQENIAISRTEMQLPEQMPSSSQLNDMPMSEPDMRFQGSTGDLTSTPNQVAPVHYPLFPLTHFMPAQGLQPEPLKNELNRIRMHEDRISRMHDDRKLQIKLECEQELEKVRKKYDMLLQDAESVFLQNKDILETIYNKVLLNQVLAEEFRAKFIESKGGASSNPQGHRTSPQLLQASQPQFVQRPVASSISMPISLPVSLPPVAAPSSLPPARLRNPSVSTGPALRPPPSVFPSNLHGPPISPILPSRPNLQVGSEARAPAPHLQRFRANASVTSQSLLVHTSGSTSQQHPLPNVVSATTRQAVPNTQTCMAPLSATDQVISGTVSSCRNASPTNLDLEGYRGVINQPSMPQIVDSVPAFDGCSSATPTLTTHGLPQSCDNVVLSAVNSDVVCISDDE